MTADLTLDPHLWVRMLMARTFGRWRRLWIKEEDGIGKYLVKWVGYPDSEATWEPAADLRHLAAAKRFEGKTPRGKRRM